VTSDQTSEPQDSAVGIADPVDAGARTAGAAEDACPSCDTPGAWKLSSRHRFNPFGGVTLLVLSFWAGFANFFVAITWAPAITLAIIGIAVMLWKRTAMVCQVCGMVETGR
jgi:hypothetical protein